MIMNFANVAVMVDTSLSWFCSIFFLKLSFIFVYVCCPEVILFSLGLIIM